MNNLIIGNIALCGLIILILLRAPIAIALGLVGFFGNCLLMGFEASIVQLQLVIWELGNNFTLITLPLFIWMGQLAYETGIGKDLYKGLNIWIGRLPGGLAIASITSSAGFGSITGSSIATVTTIGKIILPEMQRYHYDPKLASGSIASAGVLAILIPPSIPLVFYATWTETSIADLFLAGIIPGILLTLMFSTYAFIYALAHPQSAPRTQAYAWQQKRQALLHLAPVGSIILTVLISIYSGIATPTEAAGIGVMAIFILGSIQQRLNKKNIMASISHSASLSTNIFMLLVGGLLFSRFMAQTEIIAALIQSISQLQLSAYLIIAAILLMYLILGAILDTFGMIVLTLPLVYPLIISLGFDPIWFGIFLVMMIELSLITPPIGLNVFILQRLAPYIPLNTIYRGTLPFVFITLLLVIIIVCFPEVVTWLPQQLKD